MTMSLPADAARPCTCGNGTLTPTGHMHVDEGDGSVMVDLTCSSSSCRIESVHYWTV